MHAKFTLQMRTIGSEWRQVDVLVVMGEFGEHGAFALCNWDDIFVYGIILKRIEGSHEIEGMIDMTSSLIRDLVKIYSTAP